MSALVDALLLDAGAAVSVAADEFEKSQNYGELFGLMLLALHTSDSPEYNQLLLKCSEHTRFRRDLIGAIIWSGWPMHPGAPVALSDLSQGHQLLALSALTALRVDLGPYLVPLLIHPHPEIRARAFRAVGELGRDDLLDLIRPARQADPDAICRIWAAWSLALRSAEPAALVPLVEHLLATKSAFEPLEWRCLELVMFRLARDESTKFLAQLLQTPHHLRAVVKAAGWSGNTALLPWIVDLIANPVTAQTASASIFAITGLALADQGVKMAERRTDRATRDAMGDATERWHPNLAPESVLAWWQSRGTQSSETGSPQLGGSARNPINSMRLLLSGTQPLRTSAALDLAISRRAMPLFPVHAPVEAQLRLLRSGHPAYQSLIGEIERAIQQPRPDPATSD